MTNIQKFQKALSVFKRKINPQAKYIQGPFVILPMCDSDEFMWMKGAMASMSIETLKSHWKAHICKWILLK